MSSEDTKDVLKEALKEWLDEKFATFGKYSMGAIATAVFGAVMYFWLKFGLPH